MADEEEEEESSFLDRLHSCIFLLLEEATDGEGDGGLNVRGHQELSSSRDGRKGRSRKSLSTSQHGSTLVQGRRNVRTNQSLSARQEISHGSDAGSLGGRRSRTPDIDSWNDFPPIGAQSQSPTSEPAMRTVQKVSSKKKARRITPTPVGLQTSFSSSFSATGSGSWAVNPAFTSSPVLTPSSSQSQREDRRLLQEQLQRRQKTLGTGVSTSLRQESAPLTSLNDSTPPTSLNNSAPPTSLSQESAPPTYLIKESVPHTSLNDSVPPTSLSQESAPPTSLSQENLPPPVWRVQGSPLLLSGSDPGELSLSSVAEEGQSHGPQRTASPTVEVALSVSNVTRRADLDTLATKYSAALLGGRVVNIASELQSVIRLLTLQSGARRTETQTETAPQLPLRSVADASYFAVAVLGHSRELLHMLQRDTLCLLSCDARVAEFGTDLKSWLHQVISVEGEEEEGGSEGSVSFTTSDTSLGVMFNTETDSKKNFPTDRAFHAFKKQRDNFYELFRYWRQHGDQMDDGDLAARVRLVLVSCDSHVTHSHLARLFMHQLLKSCHPQGAGPSVEEGVAERLKQADLEKLKKLTQRFTSPMQRGWGKQHHQNGCYYVGEEEFFHKFIILADSYSFSEHLKHCLTDHVMKLNNGRLLYGSRKEYQRVLCDLKVLARLLGLLVCLPYKMASSACHTSAPLYGPYSSKVLGHPLPVAAILRSALQQRQMLLTAPWVMEYLGAMGRDCFHGGDDSSELLSLLFSVLNTCPRAEGISQRGKLLLSLSIGHTLELHGLSELYKQHLKLAAGCDPTVSDWAAALYSEDHLDGLDVVSPTILSICSPAIGEMHVCLAQFAAGETVRPSPARKIKPIPVFSNHFSLVKPKSKAEEQLEEAFFRSQPVYLKQLCDVVATRLSTVLEQICREEIVPDAALSGLQQVAKWCGQKIREGPKPEEGSETRYDTSFLSQTEASGVLSLATNRSLLQAHTAVAEHSERYLGTSASSTLEVLCDRNTTPAVLDMAVRVCVSWAKERLNRWIQSSLTGAIHQQLQQSFERMKRVLIGGTKGRGTFSISDTSRLFIAKRRKTPAAHSKGSLLSHDKTESTHEPSRLEPLQSTPRNWREEDSVTRERPLSSTPLADKTAPPSTPDFRPSPFSHSIHVESDSSVADSCLVGRGSAARVADTALHGGVQRAVQDLMRAVCEVDRAGSQGTTPRGGVSCLHDALADLLEGLLLDTTVEGIVVPSLLSSHVARDVITSTVNAAVVLICKGCADGTSDSVGAALLADVWGLMKACKHPAEWQHLLSGEAFDRYTAAEEMAVVWKSLGCFLTCLVCCGVVSTPELEGLWMAVLKQTSAKGTSCSVEAAIVFLNVYSEQTSGPSEEECDASLQQEKQPLQPSCPLESQAHSNPHIHFIRLLCYLHTHSLHQGNDHSPVLSPHLVTLASRLEPIILPY